MFLPAKSFESRFFGRDGTRITPFFPFFSVSLLKKIAKKVGMVRFRNDVSFFCQFPHGVSFRPGQLREGRDAGVEARGDHRPRPGAQRAERASPALAGFSRASRAVVRARQHAFSVVLRPPRDWRDRGREERAGVACARSTVPG